MNETTVQDELEKLTTTCPHCGKRILTMLGAFVQEDPEDARWSLTEGLERACDCVVAKRMAEAEKDALEAAEREKRAKRQERKAKGRFDASGMPERWWTERGLRWWQQDEASQRIAYEAAVGFGAALVAGKVPMNLYVCGDIGAGKTYLCSCLCTDLVRKGVRVMWRNMSDVLREIRASFDTREKESAVIARFVAAPVLVLDDLGKERPTEWAVEQLFSIVNARYDEGRPLIVTTNYNSEELARRLTPRPDANGYADDTTARAIVDRLHSGCKCVILEGRSRR